MSARIAPTWAPRPRKRDVGDANAGARSLPLATATCAAAARGVRIFGNGAKDRLAVDDAHHLAVLDGAHRLVGRGDQRDGVLHRRGHWELGSLGSLAGTGVAHDPP